MSFVKARINVTKVKWDDQKVATALANDPVIQGGIHAKAQRVEADARARVAASPRKRVAKVSIAGRHFSEKPTAIAKTISVKKAAPLIVTRTSSGLEMPVALVVADHPYSRYYLAAFGSAVRANAGGGWKYQKNNQP